MIASAQDYMFVAFGAGMEVDGDIMPKRADKSILRGVDAGFLREAYEERRVASGGNRASPVELNGGISSSWLRAVAAGYEDLVSRSVSYNSGRFVKPVQLTARLATSDSPTADFDMDFPVSSLASNKAAFSYGSRLGEEAVLALFTDAQALRTFVLGNPVYSSDWMTWGTAVQDDSSAVSSYTSGVLHVCRSVRSRSGSVSTGIKNAASGSLTFKVPDAGLIGGCTVLVRASVTVSNASDMFSQQKYCWLPLAASRSGNSFTVGAEDLFLSASTAMAVTNLYRPAPPSASSRNSDSYIAVIASRAYAVCTLTDHTNQE